MEKGESVPEKAASGRPAPAATVGPATLSAGECGAKDQVSRPGTSTAPAPHPGLAIVGPTAVGKTALAVELARDGGGIELVSVDAMAVYRGLDIGTAKPDPTERAGLAWHLLDCADPGEEFSVARFQQLGAHALAGIAARGRRAVLVGGTGLYHRALLDGLTIPPRYPEVAAGLEEEAEADGLAALFARLRALDPRAASRVEPGNRRRIVRALEVTIGSGRPFSSFGPGLDRYGPTPFRLVGLALARAELDRRIESRLDAQLAAGFLDEVRALSVRPGGLSRTARQALGYRELLAHLDGQCDLGAARAEILRRTRSFARRQEAWFRRDPRVVWIDGRSSDLLRVAREILEGREVTGTGVGQ